MARGTSRRNCGIGRKLGSASRRTAEAIGGELVMRANLVRKGKGGGRVHWLPLELWMWVSVRILSRGIVSWKSYDSACGLAEVVVAAWREAHRDGRDGRDG